MTTLFEASRAVTVMLKGVPAVSVVGLLTEKCVVTAGVGGGSAELALPQPARSRKLESESKNSRNFFMTSPQGCIRDTRVRFVS